MSAGKMLHTGNFRHTQTLRSRGNIDYDRNQNCAERRILPVSAPFNGTV